MTQVSAPHPFWTLAEGRSVFELAAFVATFPALSFGERGDGHPVIVFPGFLASDYSTASLRSVIRRMGYTPYGWGLGRNRNLTGRLESGMLRLLRRIHAKHERKVSLVGWSLGGTFARELAKAEPDRVRAVITMGSPISPNRENLNRLTRSFADRRAGAHAGLHAARMAQINTPPPVPTTAIFSKTDGIVGWRGAYQHAHPGRDDTENIAVPASHFGLGFSPLVIHIIADRLRQKEGDWRPFAVVGLRRAFYRSMS